MGGGFFWQYNNYNEFETLHMMIQKHQPTNGKRKRKCEKCMLAAETRLHDGQTGFRRFPEPRKILSASRILTGNSRHAMSAMAVPVR